jgi:hypothetical protein
MLDSGYISTVFEYDANRFNYHCVNALCNIVGGQAAPSHPRFPNISINIQSPTRATNYYDGKISFDNMIDQASIWGRWFGTAHSAPP